MITDASPSQPSDPERWRSILRAVGRNEAESMMRQGDEAARMLWALLRPLLGLPAVH